MEKAYEIIQYLESAVMDAALGEQYMETGKTDYIKAESRADEIYDDVEVLQNLIGDRYLNFKKDGSDKVLLEELRDYSYNPAIKKACNLLLKDWGQGHEQDAKDQQSK